MNKNFSLAKFILITFLLFIFLDLLIGSYIYKKFIRTNFQDKDVSFILKDSIFDHKFSTSYKTNLAGWGSIRFTFCTDGNGFRSSCNNQFNNLKEFDIGFAGDSFTEAIGINFEDSFVGIIQSELKDKKIANLAVASYSASIHYAKINYLLSKGYKFKEIVVFVDLSDVRDDAVCYKLENKVVKRREVNKNCHKQVLTNIEKSKKFLKRKLRLSFQFYNLLKNGMINSGLLSYKIPDGIVNNHNSDWTHNYKNKNYNDLSYQESTKIVLENMKKLSKLLKDNSINLSVAVYPWPGTLKYDKENNKHLNLWKNFCISNCKNFYNLMKPFFTLLEKDEFSEVYKKVYIKNDIHFNEVGNKIIARNFLKLYK